jgi:formamidopyrimidine-DNA glycosylase
LEYYPLGSQISEIEHLGVEPFSPNLTIKYLKHKFSPRKRAIKELLMDQGLIAGLGNIYASEILFHARIHPLTPGKELSFSNLKDLIRGTRDVLKQAIANAGTSISDYKRLDGQSGEFQNFLSVYSKNGQPCPRCKTEIQRMMINHRSTYFCPKCQKR